LINKLSLNVVNTNDNFENVQTPTGGLARPSINNTNLQFSELKTEYFNKTFDYFNQTKKTNNKKIRSNTPFLKCKTMNFELSNRNVVGKDKFQKNII